MGQNPWFLLKKYGSTALVPGQVDPQASQWITAAKGSKYIQSYQKGTFFASIAGVTSSAGLATTYTGLCVSNPAASTKNLAIRRVSVGNTVISAAVTSFGIIVGYSAAGVVTHTTPNTTLQPSFMGNATVPQALADNACTIVGTPVWYCFLGVTQIAAGANVTSADLEGALVVPPGGYVALGSSIASPASGMVGSIEWEEFTP